MIQEETRYKILIFNSLMNSNIFLGLQCPLSKDARSGPLDFLQDR